MLTQRSRPAIEVDDDSAKLDEDAASSAHANTVPRSRSRAYGAAANGPRLGSREIDGQRYLSSRLGRLP